jgi:hypothetical protein
VRRTRALLFGVFLALLPSTPATAAGPTVVATLDGRSIPLTEVSRYHCHDLEYPTIRCFHQPRDRNLSLATDAAALQVAAAGVVYVTVYDGSLYGGSSLSISQNYDSLSTIGWNDRISSFRGRNAETGRFNTDWFGGGSGWNFCCNQSTGNLSSYDNTFSSVYRT